MIGHLGDWFRRFAGLVKRGQRVRELASNRRNDGEIRGSGGELRVVGEERLLAAEHERGFQAVGAVELGFAALLGGCRLGFIAELEDNSDRLGGCGELVGYRLGRKIRGNLLRFSGMWVGQEIERVGECGGFFGCFFQQPRSGGKLRVGEHFRQVIGSGGGLAGELGIDRRAIGGGTQRAAARLAGAVQVDENEHAGHEHPDDGAHRVEGLREVQSAGGGGRVAHR